MAALIRLMHKIKEACLRMVFALRVQPAGAALFLVLTGVFLVLAASDAIARPGGGSSFGGGGSSGGGDGGDDALGFILYICIEYPQIGIPLLVLFIIWKIYTNRRKPKGEVNSARNSASRTHHIQQVNRALRKYQHTDPQFSKTIFLDFAHHLYYQYHHSRGGKEFNHLAPFISPYILQQEIRQSGHDLQVTELVIGNMVVTNLQLGHQDDSITVEIEANYTETRRGHANRFWVRDQWIFSRAKGVQSKGPEELAGLHCPNCGSHLELTPSGKCHHCGKVVEPGTQHWSLINHRHLEREVRKGKQFGTYEAERGTDNPTIVDPGLRDLAEAFAHNHRLPDLGRYFTELRDTVIIPIFSTIYSSWEAQDYQPARPLMTDNLFRSHVYWLEAYRKEGLVNRLQGLQVQRVEYAKLEMDKHYEAFTVRIYASVLDYLERKRDGKLIGGSDSRPRHFSEYWTFVRRTGVEKPNQDFNPNQCPNCGAPVDMGMTGICSYCNSKVSTGEFSWVLAQIAQDEVYIG